MFNRKFTDATAREFKEFWESEGWDVSWAGTTPLATRLTIGPGCEREINLRQTGEACMLFAEQVAILSGDGGAEPRFEDAEISLEVYGTFGEALTVINEFVGTKIIGGWA